MRRFGGVSSTLFASLVLPACGGGSPELPDGPRPPDGAPPMIDAGPTTGSVTLTAYERCCDEPPDTLKPGVQAVVIQPDGTTGDVGITDAVGEVTLDDVQAGAGIAAIYTSEFDFHVVAFLAVQPGDQLTVGSMYYTAGDAGGVDGTMTVTWPAVSGGYAFYVYHPCTNEAVFDPTATSMTINMFSYCQVPLAPIELIAYDTDFAVLQTGVIRNAPYTPGSTAALAAWDPPQSFTIDVSGLAPTVESVDLFATPNIFGLNTGGGQGIYGLVPDAGAAGGTTQVPANTDRITASSYARRANFGNHLTTLALAPDATAASLVEPGLPWLGEVTASGLEQTASWTQEAGAVPGDGAIGYAYWSRFDAPTKTYTNYDWTVIMPPGITQWSWPAGPTELAPYLPNDTDSIDGDAVVIDVAGAADYNALRAVPEWVLTCLSCAADAGNAEGTAAYSYDGGEGFAPRARWRRR